MKCKMIYNEKRVNLKGGIQKIKQVKLRIMLTEPGGEFLLQLPIAQGMGYPELSCV
jgi:hypothetical protein